MSEQVDTLIVGSGLPVSGPRSGSTWPAVPTG
ncbi:hypothetical protein SAMN05216207_102132 [Pseudonocardia ammonioxydans]|uniref:Uncharacterized protein n=1 Tax=Pseudonocardia ammonioxydans TaxID=260086 RepID=A0A1I5BU20_PSUAM|nr:hypothetical protein SAMN05216207_102132 [Pseudonocardia ammonioxydans]